MHQGFQEGDTGLLAQDSSLPAPPSWIPTVWRTVALILGAVNAGVAMMRESMNADGMNYLDMGDAFFRGDWQTAINGTWSPLYSWIVGGALRLVQPPMEWEFDTVHAVNFLLFAAALVAFEFFWRQVTALYFAAPHPTTGARRDQFSPGIWQSLGYALFIWTSLNLIEIYAVNPDMCVAICVFLAAGLLLRGKIRGTGIGSSTAFGAVLGLGYLAKAAMFPMAFVFLAAKVVSSGTIKKGLRAAPPAILGFVVVASPFLLALSAVKGRITFSDVGKFTYLKHVFELPVPHWQPGVADELGKPLHPARRLMEDPTVYEFASPVGGTYPMSYDPYYWYEGLEPRLDLERQLKALLINGRFYFELFVRTQGGFLAVVLLLCTMSMPGAWRETAASGIWVLVLVASAALGMYAVVHVTGRYIAPFVVLLWAGVLACCRLSPSPEHRRLLAISGATLLLWIGINIATFQLEGLNALVGFAPRGEAAVVDREFSAPPPSSVAQGLKALGLDQGEPVAVIGYSFDAYWARLARLKIIAEIMPEEADKFWDGSPAKQEQVIRALQAVGARAIVAEMVPTRDLPSRWRSIGETGYYLLETDSSKPGT